MVIQYINGIFYRMKAPSDLSFLHKYGAVFKIFDDQDSGNICFGVQNGPARYFIKYAGAETAEYNGTTKDAVERLKATVPVYEALRHKNLIKLLSAEEINNGFAVIFEWTDAVCMGKQYPESRLRFMSLPVEKRVKVFNDILAFHMHVAKLGYVAIDFYDGSIMYDFEKNETLICDIDFYQKQPCLNEMGRMWGSSRFMSPEEFIAGSGIDEITNVFLMGATAFALLGGELDRSFSKWRADIRLHPVALKAVSERREDRYHSLAEFASAWKEATIR
ncbi:MAG: serine/threonine protein kinase [Chloroflexi bacterium]|nr:serine/threonine protein kinase [Chloroflexota bacterium]